MRRLWLPAGTALFIGLAALPAVSGQTRAGFLSSTKAFAIDGKRFVLEKHAGDDRSLIRRELRKQGIDFALDGPPRLPVPGLAESLREDGGTGPAVPPPLPRFLTAEHALRMETAAGPIDLAFGTTDLPYRATLDRLRAAGWECVQAHHARGEAFLASMKKGRETSIVLLEEKGREFLFLRQVAD